MNNIICPKCKSPNNTDNEQECPNCGIIYKKYLYFRKNAFEDTIHTICGKGLDFSSEEFGKLSSRFPELKKICEKYVTVINTAREYFSDGNYEKALKIFTALRKKQPDLDQAIAPFIVTIESNMESDKEEAESNSAENSDVEETETNNFEEETTSEVENIGLIDCKACGNKVAKAAPLCPHCGVRAPGLHIRCPRCNSMNIGVGKRGYKPGVLSITGVFLVGPITLLGGFAGKNKLMLICQDCNNKWKADQRSIATMSG